VRLKLTINSGLRTDTLVIACKSFTWNRNGQTYTAGGDHDYIFTNAQGCQDTVRLKLTINSGLRTDTLVTVCKSFTWNRDGQTYTAGGDHDYIFTNAQGCKDTVRLKLTIVNGLRTDTLVTACRSFTWNRDGQTYTGSGDHDYTFVNALGCQDTVRLRLTINSGVNSTTDSTVCSSALPFNWNGQTINAAGTYTATFVNPTGCDSVATLHFSVAMAPNLVTHPVTSCAQGDLTAAAVTAGSDPGLIFTYWTNASATTAISNQAAVGAGTYYIKATTATGCFVIRPVTVAINSTPIFMVTNPAPVCAPGTVDLTAPSVTAGSDSGLTYTYWKDAANTIPLTNPNAVGVSGTYYIKATAAGGCTFTKAVQVIVKINESLHSMRYPTIMTTPNTPTQLGARNPGINYTYLWRPPVGLNSYVVRNPIFNYNTQTEYTITITPPDGNCPVVDTVLIVLRLAPPPCKPAIDVPNAWSPNGDGHNDKLRPLTIDITELKYFRVFNRWGQLMFETNIIGQGWDGVFNGKPQVMDVYTWTLEATGCNGHYYKRAGNSVLMR